MKVAPPADTPVANHLRAPRIGEEIGAAVFRDTRSFYLTGDVSPAPALVAFARRHAGPEVLDLGCATGMYCRALARFGFRMTGADLNPDYVRIARESGVQAFQVEAVLPFADGAFDTVLLFEVLEHVVDLDRLLTEAKRVARKNVLITVPNCEDHPALRERGLLLEHFADRDHRHFFTPTSLQATLSGHFPQVAVTRGDPLNPLALMESRPLRKIARLAVAWRLVSARYHFRLYAVASVPPARS